MAKGMKTVDDGLVLAEIGHVLRAQVQAAGLPVFGHLRHQLRVPREGLGVLVPAAQVACCNKAVRHAAYAVELRRHVKLPGLLGRLITGRDDALVTV